MLIFIFLNLFDAITTYIGIITGKCDEANLIFNNLFNEIYQIVSPINRGQFLVILNENTVVLCSL